MSCLCIGGVCIPYSALLPCLLIGLQWIASQFAKVGLLPDFVAKLLRMQNKRPLEDSCDTNGCCGSSSKRSESVITTATSNTTASDEDDSTDNEVKVEHVETLQRWEEIYTASKSSNSTSILFVKFTADWCKPCKAIQPVYISASSAHKDCTFITFDIDGDDCDILTGKLKVAMMPTFVCFKDGIEVGRMSGGNSGDKLNCWVADMCSGEKKECTTNCCS